MNNAVSYRIGDEEIYGKKHGYYDRNDRYIERRALNVFRRRHDQTDHVFEQCDDKIHKQAHADTVGYAVTQRHHDYRKERRDRILDRREIDALYIAHHEYADIHQCACSSRRRDKREKRKQEYREEEQHRRDKRRKTRLAAYGYARTRFDERRDRRRSEYCARAGSDRIRIHALIESKRLAFFVDKSRTRGASRSKSCSGQTPDGCRRA